MSFMYTIIRQLDGRIRGSYKIQDGTETSIYPSKEEAIKSLIRAAKSMNGSEITERDIKFGKEVQKVVTDIEWDPVQNHCNCCHHHYH